MRNFKLFLLLMLWGGCLQANEYNASFFGITSDGVTDNTKSIQKAIDFIHSKRGGTLVFYVGRYLTGTIQLKPRVNIRLEEGAVIVGVNTPYAYNGSSRSNALFSGENIADVKLSGKGVIEGGGSQLVERTNKLLEYGFIQNGSEPGLVAFSNCRNVTIEGIRFWNGPYKALSFQECKNVNINDLEIIGNNISSSEGIRIYDCKWLNIKGIYVDVTGIPLTEKNNQFLIVQESITEDGKPIGGK